MGVLNSPFKCQALHRPLLLTFENFLHLKLIQAIYITFVQNGHSQSTTHFDKVLYSLHPLLQFESHTKARDWASHYCHKTTVILNTIILLASQA